jgi:protease PrsW
LLLGCFAVGAISFIPALLLETFFDGLFHFDEAISLWKTAAECFIFVGLIEEGFKYACLKVFFFRRKEFNEPYNGITYAVIISMGFATVENFHYIFSGDGSGAMYIALVRAFTAVPNHAVNAVMMGYYVGLAKMNTERRRILIIKGLLAATFFHGAYDFFLMEKAIPGIWGGALVSLVVAVLLSLRAIQIHKRNAYLHSMDSL